MIILAQCFLESELFQTDFYRKSKENFTLNNFFLKPYLWREDVENMVVQSQAGRRWRYNTAHAHRMLHNEGYIYTLRIYNTLFLHGYNGFLERAFVIFYVHCLYFLM